MKLPKHPPRPQFDPRPVQGCAVDSVDKQDRPKTLDNLLEDNARHDVRRPVPGPQGGW